MFIGWILFSIFGGIGLAALPIDLIQEFQHRPKPITQAEYAKIIYNTKDTKKEKIILACNLKY